MCNSIINLIPSRPRKEHTSARGCATSSNLNVEAHNAISTVMSTADTL